MTDSQLVQAFLLAGGKVTKCPPNAASGIKSSKIARRHLAKQRRQWIAENKNPA